MLKEQQTKLKSSSTPRKKPDVRPRLEKSAKKRKAEISSSLHRPWRLRTANNFLVLIWSILQLLPHSHFYHVEAIREGRLEGKTFPTFHSSFYNTLCVSDLCSLVDPIIVIETYGKTFTPMPKQHVYEVFYANHFSFFPM